MEKRYFAEDNTFDLSSYDRQILTEVMFYSNQRKELPSNGYRPDAVFNGNTEYWGITFVDLSIKEFDTFSPAIIKFTFQKNHYSKLIEGQTFMIMEGAKQVGEGKILALI